MTKDEASALRARHRECIKTLGCVICQTDGEAGYRTSITTVSTAPAPHDWLLVPVCKHHAIELQECPERMLPALEETQRLFVQRLDAIGKARARINQPPAKVEYLDVAIAGPFIRDVGVQYLNREGKPPACFRPRRDWES